NGINFSGTFTKLINSTNFNVTNAGGVTAVGVNSGAGLLQGALGLTITGAAASINDTSNFNTTINTGTSSGSVTIGNSAAGAISLQSGSSISIGSTSSTSISIGKTGVTTTNNGALTVTQLGTFNAGLTVATGSTFTNASSTAFTAITISDVAGGGAIGTAAATVDVATTFNVNQTTASQTLSLPSPTVTTAGRLAI